MLVISQADTSSCEALPEYTDGTAQVGVQSNTVFTMQPAIASESPGIARYTVGGNPAEARFQKYWDRAFTTWQSEEDAVVLVELPSASTADALILSSAVPHVVWVSAADTADTRETVERVTSLKKTGCNLIGAVLNRAARCAAPEARDRARGHTLLEQISTGGGVFRPEWLALRHASNAMPSRVYSCVPSRQGRLPDRGTDRYEAVSPE